MSFIEELSLRENLQIIGAIKGQRIDEGLLNNYLQKLSIEKFLDSNISVLSGGERQRAALLKMIIFKHRLVLLDEPTNNLDKRNIDLTIEILAELKRKGRTMIIVSHSQEFRQIADSIVEMEALS